MTHWNFDQIKNSPDLSIMDISVKVGVQNIYQKLQARTNYIV